MTDAQEKVDKQGPQVDVEPDAIKVLEGSTFMITDRIGDVRERTAEGLYHEDTRHLNRFGLALGGAKPVVLTSREVDPYSAVFFLTNPDLDGIPAHSLTVQRHRFVGGGMRETIYVRNHLPDPVEVELRLSCGVDFADLFEVKSAEIVKGGRTKAGHDPGRSLLRFEYEHEDFRAATTVLSSQPARIDGDDLVWDLRIDGRSSWHTGVSVGVRYGEQLMEPTHETFGAPEREATEVLKRWRSEIPRLETDFDPLRHVFEKSVEDLAALRLHACVEGNEFSLPAAGLPWFMAIFGRDTLITSYQCLWIGPELARGALITLASWQGKEVNEFKDEEPGKILHEIRFGELTAIGLKPHRPYYGSAGSTQLWLILLSEYWRLTRDGDTVGQLWPNVLRALEWVDVHGDRDGDGYVEYATRSPQGLRNQGWKDSWNGVQFADGTPAEPPIALCEIQGFTYDAKLRTAELADEVAGDHELAERLRREAGELFDRFNRDFWVEGRGGYYAVGLDGEKRQIDSMTSNMGWLLWSGIVPEERAGTVADQLSGEHMYSGWGVRTMSWDDAGFNPIGYHIGTVWPHDNSLISEGLARYGFREEANRIAVTMFQAAMYTDYRLPEVFAGYPRDESRFPVRYPTASSPQAWAAAAPFLWIRVLLGLEVRDGELTADPALPTILGRLALRGVHALGGRYDVTAEGTTAQVARAG